MTTFIPGKCYTIGETIYKATVPARFMIDGSFLGVRWVVTRKSWTKTETLLQMITGYWECECPE